MLRLARYTVCRIMSLYTMQQHTLPETNMAPENNPLEKEIPDLEPIIFRGEPLVSGRGPCRPTSGTKIQRSFFFSNMLMDTK